jgi:DNA-binding MarR family transcriptional regulator
MRKEELRAFRRTLREFERLMTDSNGCACGGTDLSVSQCHHLLGIEEGQPTTVTDLAENLGLDRSTVSRTVEALASLDLVNREPSPSDRRMSKLVLTRKGTETAEEIHRERDDYFNKVFSNIPKNRHKSVVEGFALMVQAGRRI